MHMRICHLSNLMHAKAYGQLWQATVALDKDGMDLEVTVPDGLQRLSIPFDLRLHDEGDAHRPWWRCPSKRVISWRNKPTTTGRLPGSGAPRLARSRLPADGADDLVDAGHPRHAGKDKVHTGVMLLHGGGGTAVPHHHTIVVLVSGVP